MKTRKKTDKYGNPISTTCKDLVMLIAWGCEAGMRTYCVSDRDILLEHPQCRWDFPFDITNARSRHLAHMVILNWVNGIFEKEFEDCDWP